LLVLIATGVTYLWTPIDSIDRALLRFAQAAIAGALGYVSIEIAVDGKHKKPPTQ
jgi:hypothetical protein